MIKEDKELLLQDLCCRLPYDTKVRAFIGEKGECDEILGCVHIFNFYAYNCKPYLRSMSSMTDEEWKELKSIGYIVPLYDGCFGVDMRAYCKNNQPNYRRFSEFSTIEDWLNAHHLDYRGLIPMGLALEAPEGMYN